jgi:Holliday junction resolvasome RuvABC DNA-binding subunit
MERPTKAVINVATGKQTIEELSDAEIEQMELDKIAYSKQKEEQDAIAEQRATDAQAGRDALVALGLTEAQITALVGA